MLDDMAIQLSQEKSDHKEALSDLKLQHEKEVRHHELLLFCFLFPLQNKDCTNTNQLICE